MARYVQVSTDAADKEIHGGPFVVDPDSVPDAPDGRQWMTEAAARAAGYTYPVPVVPPEETNAATLRDKITVGLAANVAYLAIGAPSAAQVAAQVRALTRQNIALGRLVLGRLDAIDGA